MSLIIPVTWIDENPWQTRQTYESEQLIELGTSIRKDGLLQPPVGRLVDRDGEVVDHNLVRDRIISYAGFEEGEYRLQLALGHRRMRAISLINRIHAGGGQNKAVAAELEEKGLRANDEPAVPIQLRTLSDREMARIAWTENAERKNLSAIEEARAFQRRLEDFAMTQAELAEELDVGRSTISNKLTLLELPEAIQTMIVEGQLSERQAMAMKPVVAAPAEARAWWDKLAEEQTYTKSVAEQVEIWRQLPSDTIREKAQSFLTHHARSTTFGRGSHFDPSAEHEDEDVFQASCEGCPLLQVEETMHGDERTRCAYVPCFDRKEELWLEATREQAKEELGLSIIEEYDYSGHQLLDDRVTEHMIMDGGCDQLLLHPADGHQVGNIKNVRGLTWSEPGCDCLEKARDAVFSETDQVEDVASDPSSLLSRRTREMKDQWTDHLKSEIVRPTAMRVRDALEDHVPNAWRVCVGRVVIESWYGFRPDESDFETHSSAARVIASGAAMTTYRTWRSNLEGVGAEDLEEAGHELRTAMNELLEECECEPAWDEDTPVEPPEYDLADELRLEYIESLKEEATDGTSDTD